MSRNDAKFSIGDLIHHRLFDYRGVIVDVDPEYQGTEEWYAQMARSRPPRDAPWYHVLAHDATHTTYVAEQNLAAAPGGEEIRHPLVSEYFDYFDGNRYHARRPAN
ncbi:MAG: heat shock protein HspQ [Proteobacteria bacterium]|nr:heat shock protein HspQ [Pseudomonadota bacterium]